MRSTSGGLTQWILISVLALALGGCAGLAGAVSGHVVAAEFPEAPPPTTTELEGDTAPAGVEGPSGDLAVEAAQPEYPDSRPEPILAADEDAVLLAQQTPAAEQPAQPRPSNDVEIEEYDPWEPFNEGTFEFNRTLDRYVVKPVAKAYNAVVHERLQQMIASGLDNIGFVPRMVNCLLQGKLVGAGRELGRFIINSVAGIGGLFDVARTEFGIAPSNEDAGQTLGVWGVGPGPYLILPFLPPLTVRDGVGRVVDTFLDPLGYFVPFIWQGAAMKTGETINDRSINLELFQGFEETTVEFYSAVRNAYLQRRFRKIQE